MDHGESKFAYGNILMIKVNSSIISVVKLWKYQNCISAMARCVGSHQKMSRSNI